VVRLLVWPNAWREWDVLQAMGVETRSCGSRDLTYHGAVARTAGSYPLCEYGRFRTRGCVFTLSLLAMDGRGGWESCKQINKQKGPCEMR
jgi:hypothetical protein